MPVKSRKWTTTCKNCGSKHGQVTRRCLCYRCYNKPNISKKYESKITTAIQFAAKVNKVPVPELIRDAYDHPLWCGSELPTDSIEYTLLTMAREQAGLPARHPDDRKPNLD